jgi:hypothetical protein
MTPSATPTPPRAWWCPRSTAICCDVTAAGHDPPALACPDRGRRTKDRLTDAERAHNRDQAGLRALVEQSIGHLASAWSLRRWRGLLYRVRAVYRATAALISLGRWLHRIPPEAHHRHPQ